MEIPHTFNIYDRHYLICKVTGNKWGFFNFPECTPYLSRSLATVFTNKMVAAAAAGLFVCKGNEAYLCKVSFFEWPSHDEWVQVNHPADFCELVVPVTFKRVA